MPRMMARTLPPPKAESTDEGGGEGDVEMKQEHGPGVHEMNAPRPVSRSGVLQKLVQEKANVTSDGPLDRRDDDFSQSDLSRPDSARSLSRNGSASTREEEEDWDQIGLVLDSLWEMGLGL